MSEVLVVHAIDAEGPLGGDARRRPDGSPEFFDDWSDIKRSLEELTVPDFRESHPDSFGGPYRFNWFVLDFTGFRTNPKNRVASYHDTYDHVRSLPVDADGLYWHYHAPPASGIGDHWAESWLESDEHNVILARRLLERRDFPEAFRAGGTIEDEAASCWLEEVFLLDFSNRVSERSRPGADLYSFDWHGAPAVWGDYHPAPDSPLGRGSMRRHVYRSLDLRSPYNEVTVATLEAAFREVAESSSPRVVSFFSHDNRDMRPETYEVHDALADVAARTGIPWRSCTALDAHVRLHALEPETVTLELELDPQGVRIVLDREPFQRTPFVAADLGDRVVRLFPVRAGEREWRLRVDTASLRRLGAAVTSRTGRKALVVEDL